MTVILRPAANPAATWAGINLERMADGVGQTVTGLNQSFDEGRLHLHDIFVEFPQGICGKIGAMVTFTLTEGVPAPMLMVFWVEVRPTRLLRDNREWFKDARDYVVGLATEQGCDQILIDVAASKASWMRRLASAGFRPARVELEIDLRSEKDNGWSSSSLGSARSHGVLGPEVGQQGPEVSDRPSAV